MRNKDPPQSVASAFDDERHSWECHRQKNMKRL